MEPDQGAHRKDSSMIRDQGMGQATFIVLVDDSACPLILIDGWIAEIVSFSPND